MAGKGDVYVANDSEEQRLKQKLREKQRRRREHGSGNVKDGHISGGDGSPTNMPVARDKRGGPSKENGKRDFEKLELDNRRNGNGDDAKVSNPSMRTYSQSPSPSAAAKRHSDGKGDRGGDSKIRNDTGNGDSPTRSAADHRYPKRRRKRRKLKRRGRPEGEVGRERGRGGAHGYRIRSRSRDRGGPNWSDPRGGGYGPPSPGYYNDPYYGGGDRYGRGPPHPGMDSFGRAYGSRYDYDRRGDSHYGEHDRGGPSYGNRQGGGDWRPHDRFGRPGDWDRSISRNAAFRRDRSPRSPESSVGRSSSRSSHSRSRSRSRSSDGGKNARRNESSSQSRSRSKSVSTSRSRSISSDRKRSSSRSRSKSPIDKDGKYTHNSTSAPSRSMSRSRSRSRSRSGSSRHLSRSRSRSKARGDNTGGSNAVLTKIRSTSRSRSKNRSSTRSRSRTKSRSPSASRETSPKNRKDDGAKPSRPIDPLTKDQRTVFVSQLVMRTDERDLRRFFREKAGAEVNDIIMLRDKRTGKHKGCAYVELGQLEDVGEAVKFNNKVPDFQRFPILIKASEAEKNYTGVDVAPIGGVLAAANLSINSGDSSALPNSTAGPGRVVQNVYVGSIDRIVTQTQLTAIFSQFGNLEKVHLQADSTPGMHKGFAFLTYNDAKVANLALHTMMGQKIAGRALKTGWANNPSTGATEVITSNDFPVDSAERIQRVHAAMIQITGAGLTPVAPMIMPSTAVGQSGSPAGAVPALYSTAQGTVAQMMHPSISAASVTSVAEAAINAALGLPAVRAVSGTGVDATANIAASISSGSQAGSSVVGALLTGIPTKSLLVHNMFDKDTESEEGWQDDIHDDFVDESSKYGKIGKVVVEYNKPGGMIYVSFEQSEMAEACAKALQGRWFDGRQLRVEYVRDDCVPSGS